ncbi:putative ABC transport system ATP-binding protein [Pseudaminobacter salicylatoxidans]|uniref:Putative ABC transport system ATP-binding protein n=1 Tax=Pseudaminobacter salicylatoxidans TaxID=93369 RepID=A0A316C6C2_PSESE|nr:ATP-binding cassette domain-containing protein [Pseudaminobacter salicylatoxidans]PWJ84576.1 putative ABC transport system ATP-binding protein [Pseudaminobacter salicylatoxidans]
MSSTSHEVGSALKIVNVVKRFKTPGRHEFFTAVNRVNLTIEPGSIVAMVGSNGSGKSTLLSMIAGSQRPDEGEVYVADQEVTDMPSWQRTGLVALVRQNPENNVFSALTIAENFALADAGKSKRFNLRPAVTQRVRDLARTALAQFGMGLEDRIDNLAGNLSGGQRQAVSVAMATCRNPGLLLLDEHVSALDPTRARIVMEKTEDIVRARKVATLMVTHDMSHAIRHSDRLILMHRGQITMDLGSEGKAGLTVADLLRRFESLTGETLPDSAVLA